MNRLPASPRASRAGRCLPPKRPWPRIASAIVGIVLRLAGIYGPGRLPRRAELASGEPLPIAAGEHVNLIHVEDAAAAVLAAEAHAQPPRTYIISDGHPVERREYLAELARQFGLPPPVVPRSLARRSRRPPRRRQAGEQCADACRIASQAGVSDVSRGVGGGGGAASLLRSTCTGRPLKKSSLWQPIVLSTEYSVLFDSCIENEPLSCVARRRPDKLLRRSPARIGINAGTANLLLGLHG